MRTYLNITEAGIGLQEKGFTEDFEIFDMDLFWVQEKLLHPRQISRLAKSTD